MRVSVIIPYTDNDVDLLPRAIRSVENQTVPPYEILPIYDKDWSGIPWARNTGFQLSAGDLILPLDCDDWIDKTYLEKTLPLMVDGVGIVSTDMVYFGELEGLIMKTPVRTYDSQLMENKITVCSLVRRKAIEQAGPWDDNLRGWEDWDMWLRILRLGWKHAVHHEALFHYRRHSAGMCGWANKNKKHLMKYLAEKHPGFMAIRDTGGIDPDGDGTFRKDWNNI